MPALGGSFYRRAVASSLRFPCPSSSPSLRTVENLRFRDSQDCGRLNIQAAPHSAELASAPSSAATAPATVIARSKYDSFCYHIGNGSRALIGRSKSPEVAESTSLRLLHQNCGFCNLPSISKLHSVGGRRNLFERSTFLQQGLCSFHLRQKHPSCAGHGLCVCRAFSSGPRATPPPKEVKAALSAAPVADSFAAIVVALDSVVKVFTVSSSPNYFLPWQNKPQREITGSGMTVFISMFVVFCISYD
ncbi:hypothetical protein L7F22_001956 [Adiantum nelumboides]|nr:hypothetical protein [Adiantum nelumboides]